MSSRNREVILQELKVAVVEERRSTLRVLHLFREVEAKQLYLEIGYPSLFEFAMKELGYSAGAAHRRLQSMRLLKDLPEFESKIEDGSLSLCVAAQTQSFFRQEDLRRREVGVECLDTDAKEEVVRSVLGTSSRECEARLAALSPEAMLPREETRALTAEQTLIQFVASRELMEKLEKLKSLLAHQNFEGRYDRLFEILADLALKKWDPNSGSKRKESIQAQTQDSVQTGEGTSHAEKESPLSESVLPTPKASPSSSFPTSEMHPLSSLPHLELSDSSSGRARGMLAKSEGARRTRYVRVSVKRAVWRRDNGACTFRDPKTGRLCGSRHSLQLDHIQPYAWGGESSVANLRLRCGLHNRYTARVV